MATTAKGSFVWERRLAITLVMVLGGVTLPVSSWAFPCPNNPNIECRACSFGICEATSICGPQDSCTSCSAQTKACGDMCCPLDQSCTDNGATGTCGCSGVQCSTQTGSTCCTADSTCCGHCCCAPGTVCLPIPPGSPPGTELCQCGHTKLQLDKADACAACAAYAAQAVAVATACNVTQLQAVAKQECERLAAVLGAKTRRYCARCSDPADPDFMEVAQPETLSLPGQPFSAARNETQQEVDALNALLANEEQQIGLEGALLVSLQRVQGAFDGGSAEWIDKQNQAIIDYASQLIPLLAAEPGLRAAVQAAYLTAGVQEEFTPAEVAKFQDRVRKDGLPADLAEALTELEVDATGQSSILQDILAAQPAALVFLRGFPEALTDATVDGANAQSASALAHLAGVPSPTTTTSTTLPPGHQVISGLELTLSGDVEPNKQMVDALSKDPTIAIGASGSADDPTINGGSLRVRSSVFDNTYSLPSSGWAPVGKPGKSSGYHFKSKAGPIKSVVVQAGKTIKARGKGSLGTSLARDPRPVDVVLQVGGKTYCAQFGGPSGGAVEFKPGKIFAANNAPPAASCPP